MSGQKSYGVGDLPQAVAISDTDTLPICQSPNGCFATDASVTLHGASHTLLTSYYRTKYTGVAPVTYDSGSGSIGLAIDPATLAVVGGVLTVIGGGGGGPTPPAGSTGITGGGGAPLVGGGGAPVEGRSVDQEAALMSRIAELEARLEALEGAK